MLTGELRSQVHRLWDSFWTGGISNPLKVVEQITYLLFLKRLDDLQTLEENKSQRLGKPIEHEIFPAGKDERGNSGNFDRASIHLLPFNPKKSYKYHCFQLQLPTGNCHTGVQCYDRSN